MRYAAAKACRASGAITGLSGEQKQRQAIKMLFGRSSCVQMDAWCALVAVGMHGSCSERLFRKFLEF